MKSFLAAFFCVFVAAHQAQAQAMLTLEEARQIAIQNHPLLRAAQLTREAAAEGVKAAQSYYYPQLSADAVRAFAAPGTRIAATGGLNDPTIIDRGSLGLGVSQLITDFGRTSDLVASSKYQLESEQQHAVLTEAIVILNATRSYFDVLRAQALLRVAEETQGSRKTLLDQVQSLRDAKLRSDLDLSIAQQGLADAELLLLKARTGIDDAYAALFEALGTTTQERMTLSDTFDSQPPPDDLQALLSQAVDQNPELRALTADVSAARKLAEAEDKAGYPTVNALGYAGTTPQRDAAGTIHSNYAAAGIALDVPLYQGGRLTARAHQATLRAESLDATYSERKNRLTRDVNIAYGDTQSAFQNISVTEQLRRNAETTLDLTQTRYNIGASSIVDLNQAQLAATQAEIIHTDALFSYRIQRTLLDYQTGQLVQPEPSAR